MRLRARAALLPGRLNPPRPPAGASSRPGSRAAGGRVLVALATLTQRLTPGPSSAASAAEREYQLLRAHEIFAPLSVAITERLANELHEVRPQRGRLVVREGDAGIVAEGEVVIEAAGERLSTCGPGDGFGEIALIRDVPRNGDGEGDRRGRALLARASRLPVGDRRPDTGVAHRAPDLDRCRPGARAAAAPGPGDGDGR
ncbi:MAG TPA: cyclic nucleotide-binding domain-containing protein [Solirubrobacteraceae bacterium]|nr:cyclic nucleotide-binding domain-containing protein [Solirubrobacteraceae bacterium]